MSRKPFNSLIVLAMALSVIATRVAAADDAGPLLRHGTPDANLFVYVDWESARNADPALLELVREQMVHDVAPFMEWDQIANVKAWLSTTYVPLGKPGEQHRVLLVADGLSTPLTSGPVRRSRVRGIEVVEITTADFASARLGAIELGGQPAEVRAAIQRARPQGKGRRAVPPSRLSAGVREALSAIGKESDFWWLFYWGDASTSSPTGPQGIAVTARLADRPDMLTMEVIWFYADDATATASRANEASVDYRKGLRSIQVNHGADSFQIAQRGRMVVYSLTAPPDEVASFRKLLHRMWAGMQSGIK